MAGDAIAVEPRYPLGDAAGLLEYRRTAAGMTPLDPRRPFGPIGHTYIAIAVDTGRPLTRIPTLAELVRAELDEPADDPDPRDVARGLLAFGAALLTVATYVLLLAAIFYRWI
ncbi:hypothetical protein [Mycolicibacterium goodii]|uniref:Uncharacterized protein n=1 Tax=Mycobacterium phage Rem711 TaxID=2079285 RepID=A0A2K9VF01_9CAUD|nr:hypothetical protein [Mycolicibacterium goodii]YP_009964100.1 hypothetical protein I5J35_gp75 [Mycobacterium phage Rem711]AUV60853.1 hypothetical protein SEA_REM711_75 [Mycobacterium phage Rem711]MBU8834460.1 hypothetical protein [Mycolicibacterium goodii]